MIRFASKILTALYIPVLCKVFILSRNFDVQQFMTPPTLKVRCSLINRGQQAQYTARHARRVHMDNLQVRMGFRAPFLLTNN